MFIPQPATVESPDLPRFSGRRATITVLLLLSSVAAEAAPRQTPWLTGRALEHQLSNSRMTVHQSGQTLRRVLTNLSLRAAAPHRIALFLDRRVDPDQIVELKVKDVSLAELLNQLTTQHALKIARLGPVIYLAPGDKADRLAQLALEQRRELRKLPAARHRELVREKPARWDDLATPGEILHKITTEAKLTIENPETLPHDLWPAAELPPMAVADQLTLVLFGFELSYGIASDGSSVRIVPIERGKE